MFEGSAADAGPPGDSMYQASTPPSFMRGSAMARPPFRPPYGMMRPPMRGGFMARPRMKPMMGGPMGMPPMASHMGNGDQRPAIDPNAEIWVETQTKEGKAYFYNAKTRASAWTRPTGEGVQVLTQEQLEQLARGKKKDDAMGASNGQQTTDSQNGILPSEDGPPGEERPPGESDSMDTSASGGHVGSNGMPPPGAMGGPPSQHMRPYGMGPPFGMPHFGPPPFGPPPGFNPGFNPGGPPFMMMPPGASGGFHGAPGMFPGHGGQGLEGHTGRSDKDEIDEELGSLEIDAEIKRKAEEWKEYKTPEGKAYFHSTVTNQSVWDRPQALVDLDKEEQRIKEIQERIKNREDSKKAREVAVAALANPALAQMSTPQLGLGGLMNLAGIGGVSSGSMSHATAEPKEEKPKDMTKPVSSTPVSGTPWCVVWTGDGKVFFFNPATRTSVWERPQDLQGRSDVDKLLAAPPSEKKSEPELPAFMEAKKTVTTTNSAPAKVEEPFYKKMRTEGPPVDDEKMKKPVEELVKEDPMAAEKKAAKERALIPLEERMAQFRQLLVEKAVSAFSPWEKELHKIVFDARYLLLASRERKQVFEKYCKEKVDEERKEKKNKAKQLKESFKELLEASNLTTKSSFSDFASKHGKDERFKGVDKMRDRENLFNDFIANLKRRERDEKNALKDKLRKEFIDLLKEHKLDRYSSWTKTKEDLRHDPRYQAIESSTTKEEYFREHCAKLSKSQRSEGSERDDSEERQRKERAEASIRQREKEVAESLSVSLKQRDREREHHRHEEARQNFQALLTDLVRSSDISWHDAKKMLKKDHRYESVEMLDKSVREKMFDDHVSVLKKKKKDKFKQMLGECTDITLNMPFKDARKYIKDDPRYSKYSSSEHKCEKVYKDWMKEQVQAAMNNFRALLAETKLITYKSKQMIEDSDSHLRDIVSFLENDKRYLVLSELQEERLDILMNYIDGLHNKGAPPPPTASDPSKRNK